MDTLESRIDSIVAEATPGRVILSRSNDESCARLVLHAARPPKNSEGEPLLQVNIYHEGDVDLFINSHFGLTELDGTDPDTREMISDWTRAVLFSGYEELVATAFGRPIKLALRLNRNGPVIRTRGFWTNALSSSKRWTFVRPVASIDRS